MISPVYDAACELGASLLVAADTATRAGLVASTVTQLIPDSACAVHRVVLTEEGPHWMILAVAGDASQVDESPPEGNSLVAPLLTEAPEGVIYPGSDVRREDYAHLNVSRSVESVAYLPVLYEDQLIGAIEILTFSAALDGRPCEEASDPA